MSESAWKIDDTSHPGRVLVEHAEYPRLTGELLPFDETPDVGDVLCAPRRQCLCNIRWLEDEDKTEGILIDEPALYESLEKALDARDAAKAARR
jgi:hypothetical protein